MYINIKICTSIKSIKYIYKYIYKGSDCITLRIAQDSNKVNQYLQSHYIGLSEAIWQLFKFPIHKEFPFVIQLIVHLPGKQFIYFQPNQFIEKI